MTPRFFATITALLLALISPVRATAAPVPLILISIDGFRADYLDRGLTPNLSRLAARGVRGALRPSFPTKTFPNHYSLVTGLRPDHHGIVGNVMTDAARPGVKFTLGDTKQSLDPFWWDAAEPIWISAERAGIPTATMFWPGSEVEHGARLPHDWTRYDQRVSNIQRVDTVLDWMRRPAANRPRFVTLYFDTVDTAGHDFGPDSPEVNAAIAEIDARIGALAKGLETMGRKADLLVVSDHGMAATGSDRLIQLTTLLDPASFRVTETGPYAGIEPAPGAAAKVEAALLAPQPHMTCQRKAELPARLHYGSNARVPAIICIAETGWMISADPTKTWKEKGSHGWDNQAPEMLAGLVAVGPSFAKARQLGIFDNVDVYPLLAALLGLEAKPSDGGPALAAQAMAQPRAKR